MARTLSVSYFNRRFNVVVWADDKPTLARRVADVIRSAARRWGVAVSSVEWTLRDPAALPGRAGQ
jgi:hypothetical protein